MLDHIRPGRSLLACGNYICKSQIATNSRGEPPFRYAIQIPGGRRGPVWRQRAPASMDRAALRIQKDACRQVACCRGKHHPFCDAIQQKKPNNNVRHGKVCMIHEASETLHRPFKGLWHRNSWMVLDVYTASHRILGGKHQQCAVKALI